MTRTLIVEPEGPQEAEQTSPPNLPFSPAPQAPSRPSWEEMGMRTAKLWAERSMDPKHRVGACAMSNDSHVVVGISYNGRYPGSPSEDRASLEVGGSEFLHAEQNLLVRARWEHGEKHTLLVTHEPCHECALLILAARHINRVVFETPYAGDGKRRRGADILREAGVEVMQWRG
ncbi:deoxycytidylate deaminase [Deinococcus sp. S9]|uniref:deoxycytidylate deaminase n=1 Tax=Deinococcus sp. S9 TaxID=2545754 RepID=UPI0010541FE6|nr:deoxycytidylate deaminase [Deinococcus sp. S9]TDE87359.1 deoxycytidylate deaminase [Deinococcus sp. S9]